MLKKLQNLHTTISSDLTARRLSSVPSSGAVRRRTRRYRDAGMTILEIMIVLALIGVVTVSVTIALTGYLERGREKACKQAIGNIGEGVLAYKLDNNDECPPSMDDLVSKAYVNKKMLKDPWGQAYILQCPSDEGVDGFMVISTGKDKQEGTEDDITSES